MKKIFGNLLSAHIIITVITVIIMALGHYSSASAYISGIAVVLLYFLSGYLLTREKMNWYNYFGVACVGIAFFVICFIISPTATNYKRNHIAGLWFFYQLYILAAMPFKFLLRSSENYSLVKQLIVDYLIPIAISGLQFFGGWVKLRFKKPE